MTIPFVDTDVIVRLVTGDDPAKQQAARALFKQVEAGQLELAAPVTMIADATYVLGSPRLYALPRPSVASSLSTLVRLPSFRVQERQAVLRALSIYGSTNLDFGDTFIIASMEASESQILYSYDRGFNRVPGISRREP
ncbi:MAG TPA: PIN domain-containing protein [Thermomicrobiales bacterium]|nr:PIN domain-containing protein [Thermomicrobiales bacterium]